MAVSAWKKACSGDHVVRLFEGSGAMWTALRVVAGGFGGPGSADGQLEVPRGLQFTGDGTGLVVADWRNDRVSLFRLEDGSFVQHMVTLSRPWDVEECEGGWLVACGGGSDTIEFVPVGGGVYDALAGGTSVCWARARTRGLNSPTALALVPGVGLVVREWDNDRLQVLG